MPPPYNYDNALFGYLSYRAKANYDNIRKLEDKVNHLTVKTSSNFTNIELPKGEGKQTIDVENSKLFYETVFNYRFSSEPTIHNPKITLHGVGRDFVYTLSLSRTTNMVSIDLFTGVITVYNGVTGEIMQQFKLPLASFHFVSFSFENFDDIVDPVLTVTPREAKVS